MNLLDVSRWLWDFYLLASGLLLATGVASFLIAQPARRIALAWATAGGLVLLLFLTALPNWSLYSLASPPRSEPVWVAELEPVLGTAIQRTPPTIVAPVDSQAEEVPATQILVIDWGLLATFVLLTGSSIVAVWLTLGAWQVRRLRARAQSVPQNVAALLTEFSPRRSIQLRMLADLPVPVALGLRRPLILLPEKFVSQANPTQLRSVLAHELAHVENRDLWLLALLRLLMILLWPHPLFWWMRSRVRQDQEILADMAAAELTTRSTYAEQLVALARSSAESRLPRLVSSVGLWEKPSQLTQRIKLLLDDKLTILRSCSRNWRLGTVAVLGGLAIGLSLVTLTPAEVETQVEKPENVDSEVATNAAEKKPTAFIARGFFEEIAPNSILGLCLDENNEPLANVQIDIFQAKEGVPHQPMTIASTKSGVDGKFRFENVVDVKKNFPEGLPDENFIPYGSPVYNIVARVPGRVPGIGNELAFQIANRGKVVVFGMPRAQSLKGKIVDQGNQPVVGARVSTGFWGDVVGIPENINSAKTNTKGEFVIDDLESYDAQQAEQEQTGPTLTFAGSGQPWERFATVNHPEFARKRQKITNIPGDIAITLSPGAVLTGQVMTQESGEELQPAANAEVSVMLLPSPEKPNEFTYQGQVSKTDSQGKYRFASLPAGEYTIRAHNPGWVTEGFDNIEVPAGDATKAPQLVMSRGGRVRIQLVDEVTGEPLKFAKPTQAYINPSPRPSKQHVFGLRPNIVEFSPEGVGEIQVPAGKYAFSGAIPNKQPGAGWKVADFARVKTVEDFNKVPAYEVFEGKVTPIELRMIKEEQVSKAQITGAVIDGAGPNTERKPDTKFVPTAPPAETDKKESDKQRNPAYEDAVFDRPPPAVSK